MGIILQVCHLYDGRFYILGSGYLLVLLTQILDHVLRRARLDDSQEETLSEIALRNRLARTGLLGLEGTSSTVTNGRWALGLWALGLHLALCMASTRHPCRKISICPMTSYKHRIYCWKCDFWLFLSQIASSPGTSNSLSC